MLKSCQAQSGQAYQGIQNRLNDELSDVGEGGWGGGQRELTFSNVQQKFGDSLILNVVSHIKHQTRFLLSLNERTISHKESICMIMKKQLLMVTLSRGCLHQNIIT